MSTTEPRQGTDDEGKAPADKTRSSGRARKDSTGDSVRVHTIGGKGYVSKIVDKGASETMVVHTTMTSKTGKRPRKARRGETPLVFIDTSILDLDASRQLPCLIPRESQRTRAHEPGLSETELDDPDDPIARTMRELNLSRSEVEAILVRSLHNIFDAWDINPPDRRRLLGLSENSRNSFNDTSPRLPQSADSHLRAQVILRIWAMLHATWGDDDPLADAWMTTPNLSFAQYTPLDIARRDIAGLLQVHRHLERITA